MSRVLVTQEIRRELTKHAENCMAYARWQIEAGNEHDRDPEHVQRIGAAAVSLMVCAAHRSVDRDELLNAIHNGNRMLPSDKHAIRILSLIRSAAA